MQLRHRNHFITIRTEGSILPADLLQRINDRDTQLKGLTPDDYHLAGGLKLNEAINQSWNRLLGAWAVFQNAINALPAHDSGTTLTREKWLLTLFQELSYGRLPVARGLEVEGKSYPVSHLWQQTPIHLVSAKADLDTRTAGVAGASRISPHGLVQELLNRSAAHLWGFVSNGLRLRILRNNVSLTRQAYVEFDLEAMMTGELYPDFALLWLLCHESRVNAEKPTDCWLERWSKAAQEQGTRALEQLRKGVEEAIKALGRGFLIHPANQTLLGKLRAGTLDKQDYYRQLLRLVYRLLFLFVAEDRELLSAPEADEKARERYTRFYSVSRLRRLAERRLGTRHSDLYHGLRLVMQKLGNGGCAELGLPALGSFLFSNEAIADLNGCEIANSDLLEAIRALAFITDGHGRRTVDYRNLRSEELGSVYEALLELHPVINADARQFYLDSASGNERKTTGSYYTPDSLVQCLLDSALDPVVAEARKQPDAEAALLRLKVVDPACGSGHFLIAAAHRLSKHLASVRTGDDEPAPEAVRRALRDVIGHCIYGVDINPMAVELCKVSLWMEALEPGKPLTFLEHRIQCGNALIGSTPALLKKGIPDDAFKPIEGDDREVCAEYKRLNKNERLRFQDLFVSPREPWEMLGNLAVGLMGLEEIGDDDIADIRRKQERWEQLVRSSDYLNSQLLADAWCAAFVWRKTRDRNQPYPITEEMFRRIEENPWHVARTHHETEIRRLAEQYQFFHWHLAFPDVFRVPVNEESPENKLAGWKGGFDVVLGNPPWERLKLQEKEWFAQRQPEIANATSTSIRQRMITELRETNPELHEAFLNDRREAEGESHFVRSSNRYPLCGRGDVNTFAIFAEAKRMILGGTGRVGCIVPSGIATDDTTKHFFADLMDSRSLASLYSFFEIRLLFPDTDSRNPFCLLTMTGNARPVEKGADFIFFAHTVDDLRDSDRQFTLSAEDLALLNPNTRTCPVFRSKRDAELTKSIYRHIPVLFQVGPPEINPWNLKLTTMFHMSNDSELFRNRVQLEEAAWQLDCNIFRKQPNSNVVLRAEDQTFLPLYEGRLGHQFNHRYASQPGGVLTETGGEQIRMPDFLVEPQLWVSEIETNTHLNRRSLNCKTGLLGFRRVSRNTDERTAIACIIPWGAASYGWILTLGPNAFELCLLCAAYNSFTFDYLLRNSLSQPSIPQGTFEQIPVPHPRDIRRSWKAVITASVLELTYTAYDLRGFAEDCGYTGAPFRWDEARRFLLRAELDAAYFHLYGIGREDVDYILDTFPIVRRKDEAQHGEFRTKRVILEIYDAMQQAITSGQPYQTRLDPPPAFGWVPPELTQEAATTKPVVQPADITDKNQSDLFAWQAEDPQQQLKFDDTE